MTTVERALLWDRIARIGERVLLSIIASGVVVLVWWSWYDRQDLQAIARESSASSQRALSADTARDAERTRTLDEIAGMLRFHAADEADQHTQVVNEIMARLREPDRPASNVTTRRTPRHTGTTVRAATRRTSPLTTTTTTICRQGRCRSPKH